VELTHGNNARLDAQLCTSAWRASL
jgi:hypothetical protein